MLLINTFAVCKKLYPVLLASLLNLSTSQRIREKGIELIFQVSIRINNEEENGEHYEVAFIDSTIQEKNITYPTNAKLHKSIVPKVLDIVNKLNLPLCQSYTFVLKKIYHDQHFHYHPIQNIRWLNISDLGE